MFSSAIVSKISRLALLSVFSMGLFLASGEVNIQDNTVQIENGGVQSAIAADTSFQTLEDKRLANAAANPPSATATKMDDTLSTIISLMNLLVESLTFIITPLIMLAGWLLSPDWTFGEIFGLRPILHQLWIFISNIVYVIFGFLLVFVAFANIFGGEHSKAYEMKTYLPKLVVGMLIVPFTWFIVSAVLSISNVLTASVIQLPTSTIKQAGTKDGSFLETPIIPKEIVYNKNVNAGTGSTMLNDEQIMKNNGNFSSTDCSMSSDKNCLSIRQFLAGGGGGAYNLLSVYAYGIFKIQDYKSITSGQKITQMAEIAKKLVFGTLFFIIFGILVIAIVYALFTRAVMLWMFAIFSPLFALNHVLAGGKGKFAESVGKFDISHFISLALVPVFVSAALAFGLMFLGLVMGATGGGDTTKGDNKLESENVLVTTKGDTTSFQFGMGDGITLKTIGLIDQEAKNGVSGVLDTGKGIIGTIIMNVLALVILWMAVMAALEANDITKAAVKPISEMGNSVGELMKHAPQYVPIPGTGGQSMKSMTQGVSGIKGGIEQVASSKASEITSKFGFADAAKRNQAKTDLNTAIAQDNLDSMKKGFHDLKNTYSSYNEMKNDAGALDILKKMAGKVGAKDFESKDMTGLIKSIEEGIEHKYPSSGGLFHDRQGSQIDDGYLQSQVSKKSSTTGGKDETGGKIQSKAVNNGIIQHELNLTFANNDTALVNLDKDKKFIEFKQALDSFTQMYKGRFTTNEDLAKKLNEDLKGRIESSELTKLETALKGVADILKKEGN
ncbi:MAG: hypothetical protein PHH70_03495 [Candidatus Gracilibacteria bacterium]|nr:hypothetical protein [Candidatus Gracilibacteria bacterium]